MVTSSRESLERTHRKVEKVSEEQNYDEIPPPNEETEKERETENVSAVI